MLRDPRLDATLSPSPEKNMNTTTTTPNMNITTTTTTMQSTITTTTPEAIKTFFFAAVLNGATIRYMTHKGCNIRNFRIVEVGVVGYAKKTRRQYITALCEDIDDADEKKNRTLHIEGIEIMR